MDYKIDEKKMIDKSQRRPACETQRPVLLHFPWKTCTACEEFQHGRGFSAAQVHYLVSGFCGIFNVCSNLHVQF